MKKIDFEAHFYTRDYLNALSENKGFPRFVEDKEKIYHLNAKGLEIIE